MDQLDEEQVERFYAERIECQTKELQRLRSLVVFDATPAEGHRDGGRAAAAGARGRSPPRPAEIQRGTPPGAASGSKEERPPMRLRRTAAEIMRGWQSDEETSHAPGADPRVPRATVDRPRAQHGSDGARGELAGGIRTATRRALSEAPALGDEAGGFRRADPMDVQQQRDARQRHEQEAMQQLQERERAEAADKLHKVMAAKFEIEQGAAAACGDGTDLEVQTFPPTYGPTGQMLQGQQLAPRSNMRQRRCHSPTVAEAAAAAPAGPSRRTRWSDDDGPPHRERSARRASQ